MSVVQQNDLFGFIANKINQITNNQLCDRFMIETKARYFQVDAFTDRPFGGNPAAVCFMSTSHKEDFYFSIVKEMNLLSEMSIVEKIEEGNYKIRWFSQVKEVPLCGHATLATAHIIFNHMGYQGSEIVFQSKSGPLYAEKTTEGIRMDFPQNKPYSVDPPLEALSSLGINKWVNVVYSDTNQKLVVHLENERLVLAVKPDFDKLLAADNPLGWRGVVVTSRGSGKYDYVARYFAPLMGVNEDPVTGSAQTVLAPYWGDILAKRKLWGYQASERGGSFYVELIDNRVKLTGQAVTILGGKLKI